MTTRHIQGATYEQNNVDVVRAEASTTLDKGTGSVDVVAAATVTLPIDVNVGHVIAINGAGGAATIVSGDPADQPIFGATSVPDGTSAEVEYVETLAGNAWIVRGGGGGGIGTGELLVANIAAVEALVDSGLPNGVYARPLTVDQPFELDKTGTATADGITILNTVSSNGGVSAGRWLRIETFNKKWALLYLSIADGGQGGVYIDPFAGDDEAVGSSGAPLQTCAEACRRLHQAQAGRNYQFIIAETDPAYAGVPATDRWRPSFILEANHEDTKPTTGITQVSNATLIAGRRVIVATSTMSGAGYVRTTGGVQATVVDATLGTAGITANLGKMMVILTDATAANVGATAWIGAGPTQDATLAANTARISEFVRTDGTSATAMAAGATYQIVDPTKFAPSLIQLPSSGRFTIQNLWFTTPAAVAPADQEITTLRNLTLDITNCKWSRPFDISLATIVVQSCAFTDTSGAGTAAILPLTVFAFSNAAFNNTLFFNLNAQAVQWARVSLGGMYLERSNFQTAAATSTVAFGGGNTTGVGSIGCQVAITAPLGIYNWPVGAAAGLRIKDGSIVKASADIHGTGAAGGAGGICVLCEGGNSVLEVLSSVVPTIGTGQGGTTVATDQINIANDNGNNAPGGKIACYVPTPLVAGAQVITAAAFQTWTQWNTAGTFNRNAFNPATGGRVTNTVAA